MATAPQNLPTPDPSLPSNANQGEGTQTPLGSQFNQEENISIVEFDDPTIVVNGVLGGLPVAEKNQEYIAIVKEAGSTAPEIIDKTQFFISYLCDSDFNISKPSEDSVSLLNLTQNFEQEKNARVRVDQGTALNPQLAGLHNIHAVGTPEPLLLSQIGPGPLMYVTTMSFVPNGQLGNIPGVLVADYNMYYDFHGGYRTSRLTFDSHSLTAPLVKLGSEFVAYQVEEDLATGSATNFSQSLNYFPNDGHYFDTLVINSSSLAGKSRIKIKGHIGISMSTGSINDAFLSQDPPPTNNPKGYGYGVTLTAQLIRRRSGTEEVIYTTPPKNLSSFNPAAAALANQTGLDNAFFSSGLNATYLQISTDFISVEEDDEYFYKIVLPQETSASYYLQNAGSFNLWNQCLGLSELGYARYRTYNYFSSYFKVINETPSGDGQFLPGITGVTASYVDPASSQPDIYRFGSSSYFVNYNNINDPLTGEECFLTSSTALTSFYGGEYVQVNPGTEAYNIINANGNPSSSLFPGSIDPTGKYTSLAFGFNPIRLPFVPVAGDYIRFEYSPTKTHKILQANNTQGTLILKLTGNIDETYILDNFVIYRIINNGQYIILDVKKNTEAGVDQAFTGVVSAEFPSENLNARGDRLIFDLKQANILES